MIASESIYRTTDKQSISEGDTFTAEKISRILEFLCDGKWHTLEDIEQNVGLDANHIQLVLEFLGKCGFTSVDEKTKRVILKRPVQAFLVQKSSA